MWQNSTPPRWQSDTGPRVAVRNRAACGNTVHHHAGNQRQGRVWQYSTPPRWQSDTGPRVAVRNRAACGNHAGVSWSSAAAHAVRVRRNRVALTHANYSQQPRVAGTLAISAACGSARWQSVPRVASRGYQCRAWLALCADPETQDLSPLDVSVGGRTPSRRSLGFKIPQTRQWFVRTPVQPQ